MLSTVYNCLPLLSSGRHAASSRKGDEISKSCLVYLYMNETYEII